MIVALIVAELYVIVQVAHHLGVFATLALLVLISASGPWLVRRQGVAVWRRAQARLEQGEVPGHQLVDGVLLLVAGVLLTVPGFLTGAAGLLLFLPPVRGVVRWLAAGWLGRRAKVMVLSGDRGPDDLRGTAVLADSRRVEDKPPRHKRLTRPAEGPDRPTGL
jgi:UPF0716 protein FxsA